MTENALPSPKRINQYFHALGRFIHEFAAVEVQLQLTLWQIAKVPHTTARAIFSDAKQDRARTYINRIFKANGEELHPMLERAFAQIGEIAAARNDIVHYGASFGPESETVHVFTGAMPGKERLRLASVEVLQAMTFDLQTIQKMIATFWMKDAPIPEGIRASFAQAANAPWRYKPPAQSQDQSKPQKHGRGPRRPPKPSEN